MPAGIRLDHVSFPVTDFERSAEFSRRKCQDSEAGLAVCESLW
jgi:catechol 2,3-dioxygenase-like lactoylglutathione lyase family enzyme